ncbi:MFS transporter [Actinophytocola sp. KF-1]
MRSIVAGDDFADLRTTPYRLFFTSRTVSMLGDMMRPVVVVAAVVQAGYGATGVGFALAAEMVPYALFVLFGGVLADRYSPRRMMIAADVLRFVATGLLACAFAFGTPPLWHVLVLLGLTGLGSAAFQPGVASVVPQVSADVLRGNAVLRMSESVMTVIGPAFAGVLLAVTDPWSGMVVDAITFAISAVCLWRLRLPGTATAKVSLRRGLGQGWHEFRSRGWLWGTIVVWMWGGLLCRGPSQTLGASFIVADRGATAYGVVMAIYGAGNAMGGFAALRHRPARPLVAGAVAVTTFAMSPLVVLCDLPTPWIALGFFVHGAGATFWLVLWHSTIQTHVPRAALSRVHSFDVAGSRVATPIGRALAGPASELMGLRPVLAVAVAAAVAVPAALLSLPALRAVRARPEDEETTTESRLRAAPSAAESARSGRTTGPP